MPPKPDPMLPGCEHQTTQQRLAAELMKRNERLRRSIAARLHDGPAQGLVAAQLELSLLERKGAGGARDLERIKRALESATQGVRERLLLLGGALRIRSSPGSGTLVTLTLPMQREAR